MGKVSLYLDYDEISDFFFFYSFSYEMLSGGNVWLQKN